MDLHIAQVANILLLDEPTNDLNVNPLRALEEALGEFTGAALFVSHDRWFLDGICTHLIVFEGDSFARIYIATGRNTKRWRPEKFGKDLTPHRIKYHTLKR